MAELYDNKYRFVEELGAGGFGRVFLAEDVRSKSLVAIKQLKNEDEKEQDDIIYELEMMSKFNHPNIAIYKHNFIQNGLLYIVMEYCSVGSLRNVMRKEKFLSGLVWKWIQTLTETLQFVHDKKIIHHDIKPDNILFTENRTLKISDFGIANTGGGTRAYMSPEALDWKQNTSNDPRVDIYALGVTLLELLTNQNPFFGKSKEEIVELHDKKEFGITNLPHWQQEIVLKAIAKIPEQRFQTMKDFNEAIQAQSVPIVFDKEVIKAGDIAEKVANLLKTKKWRRAFTLLEYAEMKLKPSVSVMQVKGKYLLLQGKIKKAKEYYEKALKWNSRLDVQKDLGWINLEMKNYPTAISLLSDHLHRNPSDYEAYNLLLQCFYETNRYETAMDLAKTLLDVEENNKCFANNYYVCCAMQNIGQTIFPKTVLKADKTENHFLNYNYSVILETDLTHNYKKAPTLKSKLLFMDYRFNKFNEAPFYCTNNSRGEEFKGGETKKAIIKFGRKEYGVNDVEVSGGKAISRRHCVIVNSKDDIWIYDLNSISGTYVNGERVNGKMPLVGKNVIRIWNSEFEFTNDKNKLL
ncbi:MAG: protein kinase [Bacteroidetes bacterium]|nr:protein kinase [Bacteroidota bacterium]